RNGALRFRGGFVRRVGAATGDREPGQSCCCEHGPGGAGHAGSPREWGDRRYTKLSRGQLANDGRDAVGARDASFGQEVDGYGSTSKATRPTSCPASLRRSARQRPGAGESLEVAVR